MPGRIGRGVVLRLTSLEEGSRKLSLYAPAASEGFYEDLDVLTRAGRGDDELRRLIERYDTDILGPTPGQYR